MNELLIRFRRGKAKETLADAGVLPRDGSPASALGRARALQRALRQGRHRAGGGGAHEQAAAFIDGLDQIIEGILKGRGQER